MKIEEDMARWARPDLDRPDAPVPFPLHLYAEHLRETGWRVLKVESREGYGDGAGWNIIEELT